MFSKFWAFITGLFGAGKVNVLAQAASLLNEVKLHEGECAKSIESLVTGNVSFKDTTSTQKIAMIESCVQTGLRATGVLKNLDDIKQDLKDHAYGKLVTDVLTKYQTVTGA